MDGAVVGEGLGCLRGGEAEGAGLGDFPVEGLAEIRVLTLSREKGFLVICALDGKGST